MSEHEKDYNSPEECEKRMSQEDPIIMYLVVHEIGMSVGKIAAQVGHAVGMLYLKRDKLITSTDSLLSHRLDIWKEWQNDSFRKVTLTANDSKWNKLKALLPDLGIEHAMVIDAGLTEIPRGSETVIGVWPMRKSNRPPLLRKLQVLK
jgi:peptidyl-tRNA hydrolase